MCNELEQAGLKDLVYHTNAFMLQAVIYNSNVGKSKKDWKLFRERLSGWQENYMEGLVKEYANFLNDDKKPASEKFWELEKRIKEDKRHPGVIMEMSKSEVIWDIVRLIRLKVITYDDLSDFSNELQMEVKRILEMSR